MSIVDAEEDREPATLPEQVWHALWKVAQDMLRDQVMSRTFDSALASGRVHTDFAVEEEDGLKKVLFLGDIEFDGNRYELAFEIVVEVPVAEPVADSAPLFTMWRPTNGGAPN